MLRSWRVALRATTRVPCAAPPPSRVSAVAAFRARPAASFRSFSAQIESHATVHSPAAHDTVDTSPPRKRKSHEKSTVPSIRVGERVLAAPESSYEEALRAFAYLRDHRARLRERHFLALLEKASVAQRYDAVRMHFAQYCSALSTNRIQSFRSSNTAWAYYQSERLQLHRHVLWAMLQSGAPATRFRAMQRHYRKHELATRLNQLSMYESDALNFLLRMECTFKFVDPLARDQGSESWRARVATILDEMRTQRYRTNYSSSHALFHFLMRRPDVAMVEEFEVEEDETQDPKPTDENTEDKAIHHMLNTLFDQYPETLERDPRRMSLAVSTAASAGRIGLAVGLLRDADTRGVAVDAASFAHVVAMAKDETSRVAIADLYMRAKEHDRIYESEDNHSMKTYLLLYAIHDGNFTQMMELLHEMEYNEIPASPHTVAMLFASVAKYRAKIRHKHRYSEPSQLEAALKECPSVLQLMNNFPTVIDRNTHSGSHSILQALRSGDIDVALSVLRTTVQITKAPLRAEVFSQVLYALLATDATSKRDVLITREIEQLFDVQHPGKRDHLNAQLLNLCESNNDLETMVSVLDNWHASASAPLSKRALQRVFDVISAHLKAIRKQDQKSGAEQDDQEDEQVRYKLGSLELSFRGVLEKYPMLVPLNAATLGAALMRSASAQLVDDVATLLSAAHSKNFRIEPVVYKAALDVLREASEVDPESPARAALHESIRAMESNGSWTVLSEQFPEFAARLQE